jgi:ABC-2 type transport system permease protein
MRGSLAGTGALTRLFLRLDRLRLTVWILVLGIVPVGTASAFQGLYETEAERVQFAATVTSNPAFQALLGPLYDHSIGGLTAWRVGTLGAFLLALMMVLTMIRHTRDDEETGRRELLGSTIVGRHAPLAAALLVSAGGGLLIGIIVTAGLAALGLPENGALAFGAGWAGMTLAFAAVGAVAAQMTQAGSTGRGLAVGIAGLFFVIRMAGDAGGEGVEWISWLSPIGWFSRLRPFAGEEWWVLALWIGFAALLIAAAVMVAARRDVGEGAIPPRPGPDRAATSLRSPAGLAWRLQRASLLGWTAGIGVLGLIYGGAADSIEALLADNPQLREIFEQMGGSQTLTDAFFSAVVGIIALVATAYAIRSVLKLKVEEDSLRAEPVLATATPRARFAWSHLVYGLVGPALILAFAGALAGATYGAAIGDVSGPLPRVVAAAMAQLPAVWVLTGITMALYGIAPRLASLSWGVLVLCLILGQLGQILGFPQWSLNLSPFSHIPAIPAEDLVATPLVALMAVAVALLAAGLVGFQRRDIPGD